MTRVWLINGQARTVESADVESVQEAYAALELAPEQVDHGGVLRDQQSGLGIAIVVHQFSLFVLPEDQFYFSIRGRLYGGNAVLYGHNREGDTIHLPGPPEVMFYRSHVEVEAAIQRGELERPETRINGELVWSWPSKRKKDDV